MHLLPHLRISLYNFILSEDIHKKTIISFHTRVRDNFYTKMVNVKSAWILWKLWGMMMAFCCWIKMKESKQKKNWTHNVWNCLLHTLTKLHKRVQKKRFFRDELLNENMRNKINLYETFMISSDACEDSKMEVIITFGFFFLLFL